MDLVIVPDDVTTLTAALECVTIGGEIRIQEGEYSESLVLTDDVRLVGQGASNGVIVTSAMNPSLTVQKGHVEIENVTFQYSGTDATFHTPSFGNSDRRADDAKSDTDTPTVTSATTESSTSDTDADDVPLSSTSSETTSSDVDALPTPQEPSAPKVAVWLQGGQLRLRNCGVTSSYAGGVVANTPQSQLTMEKCRIYAIGQVGVHVAGDVQFSMDECQFEDNRFAMICQNIPSFEVKNTTIQRTGRTGVILQNASGRFEKCVIQEASSTGLDILDGGHSTFIECQFRQNVCDVLRSVAIHHSDATFENCLFTGIFANVGLFTEGAGNRVFRNCQFTQTSTAIRTSGDDLFEQCVLKGDGKGRIGIWLEKGGNPTFRQCKIMDFQTDAAQILSGSTGHFDGCEFTCTKGMRCLSVSADSAAIVNQCRFQGGATEVVRIASTTGTLFERCDILGGEGVGVRIDAAGNPVFRQNCKIYQNQRVGVCAEARSGGVFEDCEIYENGSSAVLFMAQSQTALRRCELRDGSLCALQVEQEGGGTLETCKLIGQASGHGIFVRRGGEPMIRDTEISQRTGAGIYLQEQSAGLYENCTIDQCAVGVHSNRSSPELRKVSIHDTGIGLQFIAKSAGVVDLCEIQNTTSVGVEARNSQTIFQNTKIHGCRSTGVALFDTCNMRFASCEIFENHGDGITLKDNSVASLEKCIIRNNQGFGAAYSPESVLKSDAATQMPDNRDGEIQQKVNIAIPAAEMIETAPGVPQTDKSSQTNTVPQTPSVPQDTTMPQTDPQTSPPVIPSTTQQPVSSTVPTTVPPTLDSVPEISVPEIPR